MFHTRLHIQLDHDQKPDDSTLSYMTFYGLLSNVHICLDEQEYFKAKPDAEVNNLNYKRFKYDRKDLTIRDNIINSELKALTIELNLPVVLTLDIFRSTSPAPAMPPSNTTKAKPSKTKGK